MPRSRRPRPPPTRWRGTPGVILPFPGGVVRSGSKVGSRRIKTMIASTNDAFCPTLRAVTQSALPDGVNSVLEIVINGTDADAIASAMRLGIDAACRDGVVAITAGNYGGKLGPHHFHLRKIMGETGHERRTRRPAEELPGAAGGFFRGAPAAWAALTADELAGRPVELARGGHVPLGDLFEVTGNPDGRVRFTGDLSRVDRLAAGLTEGAVIVEGNLGDEVGLGMARGRSMIGGDAGDRAGAAAPGFKRGMTGGELIVRGSAGAEAGRRCAAGCS